MANTLTINSQSWATGTDRFFTRGRSTLLQAIDTNLQDYDTALKTKGWDSEEAEDALVALRDSIDSWKAGRGTKSNGNIASCRDSKGLVTRLRTEVDDVLGTIKGSLAGKQRGAKKMAADSSRRAIAENRERVGGNVYEKTSTGGFKRVAFSQEQNNSCACACACTFASYVSDVALREDTFRETYDRIKGNHHDFNTMGTRFPLIARTLQALKVDVVHVDTGNYPALASALRNASQRRPVLFGISWGDGTTDLGSHALICTGTTNIEYNNQLWPGFRVEDPWGTNKTPMLFDDGTYWVYDSQTALWSEGYANYDFGYVKG
jgi:hypothetical protein